MSGPRKILATFAHPPAIGTALMFEGQVFELVSAQPHTRKDGAETVLLTWRATCLNCPAIFETVTGLQVQLQRRRCEQHKARAFALPRAAAGGG